MLVNFISTNLLMFLPYISIRAFNKKKINISTN